MTENVLNKHKAKRFTLNMTLKITIIWQEHEHDFSFYYIPCCIVFDLN